MSRALLFFVVFVVVGTSACTREACPKGPGTVAVPVTPPGIALSAPTANVGPAAPSPSRPSPCFARGRPRGAAAVPKPAAGSRYCASLDAQEVLAVEARIRKDFVIYDKPSKLVVDFGCDEAFNRSRELVYESGSGHGGSLTIVRFRWEANDQIVVRRISSSHYYNPGLVFEQAETTAARLDPIIERSRVALVARPHLVRLTTKGNTVGIGGASFSSNDFHLRLRLTDEKDLTTEGHFTGYDSSGEQERILPMRIATEPIDKVLTSLSFRKVDAQDDDRSFFTTRFTTVLAEDPYWWVKERYVALAGFLGTPDAIPALVALTQVNVKEKSDASVERTRESAIDSLTRITGWNPRVDATNAKRTIDEIAKAVAHECSL